MIMEDGIVPNKHYDISFYNTREAGQTLPINLYSVLADGNGHLTINLSTPISCDTMNADFAFIVSRIASGNRTIAIDSTDLKIVNFSVYPNPSLGTFEIKIPDDLVSAKNKLILYDAVGKIVFQSEISSASFHLTIELTPGVYTLQLQTPTGNRFKKLIIQK